jgi:hypothetical protein
MRDRERPFPGSRIGHGHGHGNDEVRTARSGLTAKTPKRQKRGIGVCVLMPILGFEVSRTARIGSIADCATPALNRTSRIQVEMNANRTTHSAVSEAKLPAR